MLVDRITGTEREVDICIEGAVGAEPVMVCIECCDTSRPADVLWVDEIKAKHERLSSNALILASRNGFTNEAKAVADKFGIKTISLEEVDHMDFPKLLEAKSSFWAKSITLKPNVVRISVVPTESLAAETVRMMPDNLIYGADGHAIGTVHAVVMKLLELEETGKRLLAMMNSDHRFFELKAGSAFFADAIFLKRIDPEFLRRIESIHVVGPCDCSISEFALRRGKLGNVQLAWGDTEIVGRPAKLVVTRDDLSGIEKIVLSLDEKVGASADKRAK